MGFLRSESDNVSNPQLLVTSQVSQSSSASYSLELGLVQSGTSVLVPGSGQVNTNNSTVVTANRFLNSRRIASRACVTLLIIVSLLSIVSDIVYSSSQDAQDVQDATHIIALLGESVVFNCPVDFPSDHPVPYVMQWEKKVRKTDPKIPIFIWYENYPTHSAEGYEGRVSRVPPGPLYGLASLNLTNIRESDQGWYECKVQFLNRSPSSKNGTWFQLDVHAPPKFVVTPEEVIYVSTGDSVILNCQAEGTPTPEIIWYKNEKVVNPSTSTGVFNDGTELRISNIRREDIGDYTCIARNGEGRISHTARVVIAGGAVITSPPQNQTKLEGDRLEFMCRAKALPGNVTHRWTKDGLQLHEISGMEARVSHKRDGTLVISPVSADDFGLYTCEVSNGIGEPRTSSAYLSVEYAAKVTYTPTLQYLPFRMGGVINCYIKSNPPLQYVTWTKDKRLLEPYQMKDLIVMNNGSLLFTIVRDPKLLTFTNNDFYVANNGSLVFPTVNQNVQGRYTCTPYNAHGTQGSSGEMEVLVKKPPQFTIQPNATYHKKAGETIEMHCDAQEGEGTQKPKIEWRRKDGHHLKKDRYRVSEGNITIEALRRTDFGVYQCVASNEVATIVADTQLIMEGTQPHAPYNLSVDVGETEITVNWLPGYSGGPNYKQEYFLWYRETGISDWNRVSVEPPSATSYVVTGLKPSTLYEFQVVGKNALGDGMLSKILVAKTLEAGSSQNLQRPTNAPTIFQSPSSDGPRPGPPKNITVQEVDNGFIISWEPPQERSDLVKYYTIMYRTDNTWKELTKRGGIRADETKYLVKNMVGGRTYFFRVIAHGNKTYESSEELKYSVPARVKQKAIIAGIVGGILFFIVAIILSICAVKICNKRKRRKQEKAYNIVACRITDARNGGQIPTVRQVPMNKPDKRPPCTRMLNILLTCITHPDGSCIYVGDVNCKNSKTNVLDLDAVSKVRPIARTADGRFILSTNSSSTSINSSLDDGGFLNHPAFRHVPPPPPPPTLAEDVVRASPSRRQNWTSASRRDLKQQKQSRIGNSVRSTMTIPIPTSIYTSNTPFLSSSPASTVISPFLSPAYFSDLSSVQQQPGSAERAAVATVHHHASATTSCSQELPSLRVIHEENQRSLLNKRILLSSYSPNKQLSVKINRPNATVTRYNNNGTTTSVSELVSIIPSGTSPDSRSSSSGLGSKNTSQQTGSSVTCDWRSPPYRDPPTPATSHTISKLPQPTPSYMRTWLDYTPSPTHSIVSNKPLSVDGHYEFDSVFPTSPTPTEMALTPLPPPTRTRPPSRSRVSSKQEYIEARVRMMKEEFHEYRRRQAQMRTLKELESIC